MIHRAAVLGSPVAHSLSPVLHRTAYDVLGLADRRYDAFDVVGGQLQRFIAGCLAPPDGESWSGLSLTMPLKHEVLRLLHHRSHLVDATGAANTVVFRDGRLLGDNTDVPGMRDALSAYGIDGVRRAAVLGGGATARSAVAALASVSTTISVYVRTASRAGELAEVADRVGAADRLTVHDLADVDELTGGREGHVQLVVNTMPGAAADGLVGRLLPATPEATYFDVLYDPWPTALAGAWAAAGGRVIGGLELLVRQAALQVEAMTGAPAGTAVAAMLAAGEAAQRERGAGIG